MSLNSQGTALFWIILFTMFLPYDFLCWWCSDDAPCLLCIVCVDGVLMMRHVCFVSFVLMVFLWCAMSAALYRLCWWCSDNVSCLLCIPSCSIEFMFIKSFFDRLILPMTKFRKEYKNLEECYFDSKVYNNVFFNIGCYFTVIHGIFKSLFDNLLDLIGQHN